MTAHGPGAAISKLNAVHVQGSLFGPRYSSLEDQGKQGRRTKYNYKYELYTAGQLRESQAILLKPR